MGTAAAHHFADHWEDAIATGIDPTSWAYAEDYTGEDEVVTGTGVSGLALLRGMRADGTLTTVDIDAENQRLARKTFLDAGVASNRFRLIAGAGLDVVTRLTDGHYDLVFCDADRREN